MTYYVVRVTDDSGEIQSLIFVLRRDQNLMQQLSERVKPPFQILGVHMLGVQWP